MRTLLELLVLDLLELGIWLYYHRQHAPMAGTTTRASRGLATTAKA